MADKLNFTPDEWYRTRIENACGDRVRVIVALAGDSGIPLGFRTDWNNESAASRSFAADAHDCIVV
ncbi:MAG: hypothetical protein ACM3SP_06530 [Chloroflexota bacterium]